MRLATVYTRVGQTPAARTTMVLRVESPIPSPEQAPKAVVTGVPVPGFTAVGELLQEENWRDLAAAATGETVTVAAANLAPVIPNPGKIICVGVNYLKHIKEMGHAIPEHPTLFIKFPEALTGPYDEVNVPEFATNALDFEGELAVIIGKRAFRVSEEEAPDYIGGWAVLNDYTQRDLQNRGAKQWHQGKSLYRSAGFGPWLTTSDSWQLGGAITTTVDGIQMQHNPTDDMVFGPAMLISYISQIYPLNPGDVISTGTPSGVGHARDPKAYIQDGQTVTITIDELGTISNTTRYE